MKVDFTTADAVDRRARPAGRDARRPPPRRPAQRPDGPDHSRPRRRPQPAVAGHAGISGSAVNGVDYTALPSAVTLPAGRFRLTLKVHATNVRDGDQQEAEGVHLRLRRLHDQHGQGRNRRRRSKSCLTCKRFGPLHLPSPLLLRRPSFPSGGSRLRSVFRHPPLAAAHARPQNIFRTAARRRSRGATFWSSSPWMKRPSARRFPPRSASRGEINLVSRSQKWEIGHHVFDPPPGRYCLCRTARIAHRSHRPPRLWWQSR